MTFTVTLQLEGFAFPHFLGAFSLQISFLLCPPYPPCTVYMQQQQFSPHQKDEVRGATS